MDRPLEAAIPREIRDEFRRRPDGVHHRQHFRPIESPGDRPGFPIKRTDVDRRRHEYELVWRRVMNNAKRAFAGQPHQRLLRDQFAGENLAPVVGILVDRNAKHLVALAYNARQRAGRARVAVRADNVGPYYKGGLGFPSDIADFFRRADVKHVHATTAFLQRCRVADCRRHPPRRMVGTFWRESRGCSH